MGPTLVDPREAGGSGPQAWSPQWTPMGPRLVDPCPPPLKLLFMLFFLRNLRRRQLCRHVDQVPGERTFRRQRIPTETDVDLHPRRYAPCHAATDRCELPPLHILNVHVCNCPRCGCGQPLVNLVKFLPVIIPMNPLNVWTPWSLSLWKFHLKNLRWLRRRRAVGCDR